MTGTGLVVLLALTLLVPAAAVSPAHYIPGAHDRFAYAETVTVNNGFGNYSGYSDSTVINGSVGVTDVLPNGTDQAYYYNVDHFQNSSRASESWTASGTFVFSPQTFLYVNGTDNQTGYSKPTVWFFMDDSLAVGATFSLLNSEMQVVSTSFNYDLGTTAGGHVEAIFTEGNGSYERDDAYGVFSATYNWKSYFDPTTGFIIGYLYTEQDTAGDDGFTLTDSLAVTQTSYALTPGTGSSSSSGTGNQSSNVLLYAFIGAVVVVVIIVIIVVAVLASRRRRRLPRHSMTGQVPFGAPPMGPPPPPINLTPAGQPPVQQIIIKETVKVNCQYCGSLIDSTAEKCPFCGATRT